MSDSESLKSSFKSAIVPKPYCTVGAGQLTSFVWKSGDESGGWRYRFNIFRLSAKGSRVNQLFSPRDLFHFVKLTQVLAAVFSDDGCLSEVDRGVLKRLAAELDSLLMKGSKPYPPSKGESHGNASHP